MTNHFPALRLGWKTIHRDVMVLARHVTLDFLCEPSHALGKNTARRDLAGAPMSLMKVPTALWNEWKIAVDRFGKSLGTEPLGFVRKI